MFYIHIIICPRNILRSSGLNIFILYIGIECLILVSGLLVPNIIHSNFLSHFKSFEIELKKKNIIIISVTY